MRSATLLFSSASVAWAYTVTTADRFLLKNIDPIVFPGQYDVSHMHSFFGSDAVTVNTTTSKELQAGCSTAENPNDYSIYWVPTLVAKNDTGLSVVPLSKFSAYYVAIESAEVAIPQDYKSVAGNSKATSQADVEGLAGISWFCEGDSGEEKDLAAFPSTTCSTHLQTLLLFHDCVNEETLESTYSGTQHWTDYFKPENRCPSGMKRMPQLRFSIRYDLRKVLPDGWDGPAPLELACGPSYCSHGDFINGWLPEAAENMLLANDKREFQGVDGPAGVYNAGSVCGSENAEDADPEHGTSDYEESQQILEAPAADDETAQPEPSSPASTTTAVEISLTSSNPPSVTTTLEVSTTSQSVSFTPTAVEVSSAIVSTTSTAPGASSTKADDGSTCKGQRKGYRKRHTHNSHRAGA